MTHSTEVIYQSNPITGDAVNHPKHYISDPSGIECIQIVRHRNFNIGNAIKYLWRAGLKDGNSDIQDLQKAVWYIQDEIKRLEALNQAKNSILTGTQLYWAYDDNET